MRRPPPPLRIIGVASRVYWPDKQELQRTFSSIAAHLSEHAAGKLDFHLIESDGTPCDLNACRASAAVVLPLSGAVQPLLIQLSSVITKIALANGYLPGFLPKKLTENILHRNAHPACTDFFAHQRLARHSAIWLSAIEDFRAFSQAHQAVEALRQARFLRIGETEPWVINSTRDLNRFSSSLGCQIIPLEADVLHQEFANISDDHTEAVSLADDWWRMADKTEGTLPSDARKAARVAAAMQRLLKRYDADGLAMACFAMIGALDTTSCLALSTLNDAAHTIGACEGDLDAAATLYLLKQLGADFVWIANPIIHPSDFIDLAHCTAPRCACGRPLSYRLLRHHESGRGIAPEVQLPEGQSVTLARIGADLTELCIHPGRTERVNKLPTCHTQIRVHIPSSRTFLETMNGTHVVMSYGDWRRELAFCADLLDLQITGFPSSQRRLDKSLGVSAT